MLHLCPNPNSNDASRIHRNPRHQAPAPWILRIDGVGSYQIVTEPVVTIGSIHARPSPAVGLMINPDVPTVRIERCEEDYLLCPADGLAVNGQPLSRQLLRDGDRISLSGRARLKFHRPNIASLTALLRVGGTRLPQGDVRQVILMDRELLIDRRATGHIRSTLVRDPVTLVRRGWELTCGSQVTTANGQQIRPGDPLPLDQGLSIGHLGLMLSRSSHDG